MNISAILFGLILLFLVVDAVLRLVKRRGGKAVFGQIFVRDAGGFVTGVITVRRDGSTVTKGDLTTAGRVEFTRNRIERAARLGPRGNR